MPESVENRTPSSEDWIKIILNPRLTLISLQVLRLIRNNGNCASSEAIVRNVPNPNQRKSQMWTPNHLNKQLRDLEIPYRIYKIPSAHSLESQKVEWRVLKSLDTKPEGTHEENSAR